jgi:hypothetical protein
MVHDPTERVSVVLDAIATRQQGRLSQNNGGWNGGFAGSALWLAVLVPARPAPAATTMLWIEALAAEPDTERFGVRFLGKTEHLPPLVFVIDRVSARAQRQSNTEGVQRPELRTPAILGA